MFKLFELFGSPSKETSLWEPGVLNSSQAGSAGSDARWRHGQPSGLGRPRRGCGGCAGKLVLGARRIGTAISARLKSSHAAILAGERAACGQKRLSWLVRQLVRMDWIGLRQGRFRCRAGNVCRLEHSAVVPRDDALAPTMARLEPATPWKWRCGTTLPP